MDNFYQKAIDLKISYSWDDKEWSRRTGIRQDILTAVESGSAPEDKALLDMLLQKTKLGKIKDTSQLKRFPCPNIIAVSLHKGGAGKTTGRGLCRGPADPCPGRFAVGEGPGERGDASGPLQ